MAAYLPAWIQEGARSQRRINAHGAWQPWAVYGCVLLLSALYCLITWRAYPPGRTDIGADYAYVSWQMSRGATLYHSLQGYQTPLLYMIGAGIYRLWPQPDAFLALALVVRTATALAVCALARASRFSAPLAIAASLIFLLLPMGFLFGAHFEPNIIITLGGALCALALTHVSRRRVALAGIGCAIALMAKLTFAPLALGFAAYVLMTRRSALATFVGAMAGALLLCLMLGLAYAGPSFITGAFL